MIISRRNILTGAVASLFMPGIVRADSLMKLTGVPMDPWVLSYIQSYCVPGENLVRRGRYESVFNFGCGFNLDGRASRAPLSQLKKIQAGEYPVGCFPSLDYKIVRLSECDFVSSPPRIGDRNG